MSNERKGRKSSYHEASIPPWDLGLTWRPRPSWAVLQPPLPLPGFGLRRLTAARFRGSGWQWPLAAAPHLKAAALIVVTDRAGSFVATFGKKAPVYPPGCDSFLSPIYRRCRVGPVGAVGEEKRNALWPPFKL